MRRLQGKRIVPAAGAAGIGATTAERLTEEGASLAIRDLHLYAAQTLTKGLDHPT
ncbi:hypothetical protein IM697_23680 [Streptomyces ferrugineus]|uniref:Short-chain dehydrogenase n=1 Tax=Streptomyces ferrugineus TaxID=1413221 RepID=A0A7M2SBY8_9ACTN|nr:hypothetical protein [Streptomyces ferrugineus]QOV33245.1 hypothetical protein IM697_23680 [Streptomyces ferrugineus]